MELGTHDVVRMTCQNSNLVPILPVPNAHRLVIAGADDPGELHVELHRAYVVHMPLQSEHALLHLVVPELDQMVVASRDKHRLSLVEINASHRPIVVLELVEEALCPVIKQVNASIVQGSQDPWAILMESQAFYALAFRFKLSLHHFVCCVFFYTSCKLILIAASRV